MAGCHVVRPPGGSASARPAQSGSMAAPSKEAGDIVPKRQGGDRKSQHIEAHSHLIFWMRWTAKPDLTLAELRNQLGGKEHRRIGWHRLALALFPATRKLTQKKTAHAARAQQARRCECRARRLAQRANRSRSRASRLHRRNRSQHQNGAPLLTGVHDGVSGAGPGSRTAIGRRPLLPPARSTGLIAPLVLDGAMDGVAFRAYVEQFLAPPSGPATS